MAGNPSASKWDMGTWVAGPVTLFEALGIKKGTIQYPSLQAELTEQGIAQNNAQTGGGGSNSSTPADNQTYATGSCTAAQTAANQKLAQQLLPTQWASQWQSIQNIVNAESGWCNTAQNQSSTAYGIGQFLNTTWAGTGYTKTSSPKTQILAMYAYIAATYGNPNNAWNFHRTNGYY